MKFGSFCLCVVVLLATGVGCVVPSRAADVVAQARSGVIKFNPALPAGSVLSRPDSDMVELSDGRRLRVGDVRRLTAAAQRLRSAPTKQLPSALLAKPAASGKPIHNASDLADALKRPDNETVQLPSGRRVTVGQIKLLQPQIEKRVGRSLAKTPARTSQAVKVGKNPDWKNILQQPDDTILEAPNGARVTVGALKQALAETTPATGVPGRR